MDALTEKQVKEQLNEIKQSSSEDKQSDELDLNNVEYIGDINGESEAQKSLKHIQEIFQKTEAMKLEAKEKGQELEDQFKVLKERLNSSSEYLIRIKKNIENIKFSYQRNVIELQKKSEPPADMANHKFENREDMEKYIEDVRQKMDDLQNRMTMQKEKQQHVTESYEEAFNNVVNALQKLDTGECSSVKFLGDAQSEGDK
ncbi:unnamed protein product [Phyllotreta striolata]|uniref:Uncharacterized protein n=1 Tax=Phyllotreta striolata TaxID=444603 RepID=A0A9N9TNI1_PHYSR|nr:unnamed protein product [Phyllotreta striolata]